MLDSYIYSLLSSLFFDLPNKSMLGCFFFRVNILVIMNFYRNSHVYTIEAKTIELKNLQFRFIIPSSEVNCEI